MFGVKALVHVPKQRRRKLDDKAEEGIFLGYDADCKAWRFLVNGKIVVSRDARFAEGDVYTVRPSALPLPQPPAVQTAPQPLFHDSLEELSDEAPGADIEPARVEGAEQQPAAIQPQPEQQPQPQPQPHIPEEPPGQPQEPQEELPDEEYDDLPDLIGYDDDDDESIDEPPQAPQLRRSGRVKKQTVPFTPGDSNPFPTKPAACAAVQADFDNPTVEEALARPDADLWRQAIDEEMQSIMEYKSYELCERPPGVKPIPCKFVLKIKRDARGNIERYKARLVAKGFLQRPGIDYEEVYAPVSKYGTLRALAAKCAAEDLEVQLLDVSTAFLNGELEEDLYMQQPPGYALGNSNIVCRLRRTIYGLKQAPRAWHQKLLSVLKDMGFEPSAADPSLFIRGTPTDDKCLWALIYVDDMWLASRHRQLIEDLISDLRKRFKARVVPDPEQFLGLQLSRDRQRRTLTIHQERYANKVVQRFGMSDAKTKPIPLTPGTPLTAEGTAMSAEEHHYSELIGCLLYLAVCTRPDISFAVGALARFLSAPKQEHWHAAKGLLRYVSGTASIGITFGTQPDQGLRGYCDADHGGNLDSRRSTTGFVFTLFGAPIIWKSKLQCTTATSTLHGEYMSASEAGKEALWLRILLPDLGQPIGAQPVPIACDNQGAIQVLKNPIASVRSKHIDVQYHFIREHVACKNIEFKYCRSGDNVADVLTKPLPEKKFLKCRDGLGLI